MSSNATKSLLVLMISGVLGAGLTYAPASKAFNFGDMMNPGKWMGGGNRYDDWDEFGPYGGPYGGPGPYGPYGAPYGPGGYGPGGPGPYGGPGFGAPGFYGAPGYRPAPAAQAPVSAPSASTSRENVKSAEIEALKRRIEELEAKQKAPSYTPPPSSGWGTSGPSSGSDWGSAPAFRPVDKY